MGWNGDLVRDYVLFDILLVGDLVGLEIWLCWVGLVWCFRFGWACLKIWLGLIFGCMSDLIGLGWGFGWVGYMVGCGFAWVGHWVGFYIWMGF